MIGVTGDRKFKSCEPVETNHMSESILEAAMKAGKATGIVTTARVTHASPAGCYAHVTDRHFENDK